MVEPAASTRRTRPNRRWLVIVVVVGLLVILWVLAAGLQLARGVSDARAGMADINDARAHLSAADAVGTATTNRTVVFLHQADAEFTSARSRLESSLLAPVDILPVAGRQLRSVQALAGAAALASRTGAQALGEAHSILDVTHEGGPQRIAVLRELSSLAATTDTTLAHLDTGPSGALIGPVATKRGVFVQDVAQIRAQLHHAAVAASTVAEILQGPRTYLVLMGNNAEMRDGSGAFLETGVLTTDNGEAHLADVQPTLTLAPGQVSVGGQLEANWGWLKPGVDGRNLGVTPQFDVNGALAAQMWEAKTGQHVDGVLAVDVETMRQILEVTGPVTLVDGTRVGADDVVQLLLHDQYEGLSIIETTGAEVEAEAARQELIGSLAQSAFDALENQPIDLRTLATAMSSAAEGRHLLVWSAESAAEAAWTDVGVAGRLNSGSLMVGLINRSGTKLDQYVSVHVSLALRPAGPAKVDGTLSVEIANHTPPGQSSFIAGPNPELGTPYGEYVGILSVNVPGYASRPIAVGDPMLDALGGEGPTWVIAVPVDVRAGGTQIAVFRFVVPAGVVGPTVVPSARIPAVVWTVPGGQRDDSAPFSVRW